MLCSTPASGPGCLGGISPQQLVQITKLGRRRHVPVQQLQAVASEVRRGGCGTRLRPQQTAACSMHSGCCCSGACLLGVDLSGAKQRHVPKQLPVHVFVGGCPPRCMTQPARHDGFAWRADRKEGSAPSQGCSSSLPTLHRNIHHGARGDREGQRRLRLDRVDPPGAGRQVPAFVRGKRQLAPAVLHPPACAQPLWLPTSAGRCQSSWTCWPPGGTPPPQTAAARARC